MMQGAEERYIVGTSNELLKWKFAHLNSVDFQLQITPSGGVDLASDLDLSTGALFSLRHCS